MSIGTYDGSEAAAPARHAYLWESRTKPAALGLGELEMAEKRDGLCQDAVCIDAGRVYDSCADKDCFEDLRVYFNEHDQQLIDCAASARVRKVEVHHVTIDVEALPFNRGYYACDLTYCFEVTVELCIGRGQPTTTVRGIATTEKKVILYGSEGNVRVFCNDGKLADFCSAPTEIQPQQSLPRCCVQVADPVMLCAKLEDARSCKCYCCPPPDCCLCCCGGLCCETAENGHVLLVSIGVFSIVQLIRNVQMLVPVYDYCMPCKECTPAGCGDSPCDAFRKLSFPVDEFFPPNSGCKC